MTVDKENKKKPKGVKVNECWTAIPDGYLVFQSTIANPKGDQICPGRPT